MSLGLFLAMMFSFLNSFWKVSFAISPSIWAFLEPGWFNICCWFGDWILSQIYWVVSEVFIVCLYFCLDIKIFSFGYGLGIWMVRLGWMECFKACFIASSFKVFIPSNLNLLILSQNAGLAFLINWVVSMKFIPDLFLLVIIIFGHPFFKHVWNHDNTVWINCWTIIFMSIMYHICLFLDLWFHDIWLQVIEEFWCIWNIKVLKLFFCIINGNILVLFHSFHGLVIWSFNFIQFLFLAVWNNLVSKMVDWLSCSFHMFSFFICFLSHNSVMFLFVSYWVVWFSMVAVILTWSLVGFALGLFCMGFSSFWFVGFLFGPSYTNWTLVVMLLFFGPMSICIVSLYPIFWLVGINWIWANYLEVYYFFLFMINLSFMLFACSPFLISFSGIKVLDWLDQIFVLLNLKIFNFFILYLVSDLSLFSFFLLFLYFIFLLLYFPFFVVEPMISLSTSVIPFSMNA